MSSPQVYLLSAPSGAGKTTSLVHYVDMLRKEGKSVGGVLQIVKNKRRHIRFLSTDEMKLLQINDVHAHNIHHDQHFIKSHGQRNGHSHGHSHGPNNNEHKENDYDKEKYVKCGRFLCSKKVLDDTQIELNNSNKYDYIMIDEVGNWEMKMKMGYEPALSNILSQRKNKFKNCNFIIV
eukprot:789083_1